MNNTFCPYCAGNLDMCDQCEARCTVSVEREDMSRAAREMELIYIIPVEEVARNLKTTQSKVMSVLRAAKFPLLIANGEYWMHRQTSFNIHTLLDVTEMLERKGTPQGITMDILDYMARKLPKEESR